MNWTFWLRLIAIPAGIVSALVFARDGFHFFLHGAINALFLWTEKFLGWLLSPLAFLAEPLLGFIEGVLALFDIKIDLVLQSHW